MFYLLTSHVVTVADSGLSFLVSRGLFGQHLFGSIEVRLGATGQAMVDLGSHAMLRDLPTCPNNMFTAKSPTITPFQTQHLSYFLQLRYFWNDEWWQLLGSAGKSLEPPWQLIKALNLGCPWRSAELTLSNQNQITHNVATDHNENTQWRILIRSTTYWSFSCPGTATRFGENCVWLKPPKKKDIEGNLCFVDLQSYSPSRQQIPNSKFPCSIPVLGIHHPLDKNCSKSSIITLSLSLSLENPAAL